MWAAIAGAVTFIYIAIFSLLKSSSRGEETSRKHRAELMDEKEELSTYEESEEIHYDKEKPTYKSEASPPSVHD